MKGFSLKVLLLRKDSCRLSLKERFSALNSIECFHEKKKKNEKQLSMTNS